MYNANVFQICLLTFTILRVYVCDTMLLLCQIYQYFMFGISNVMLRKMSPFSKIADCVNKFSSSTLIVLFYIKTLVHLDEILK